MKHDSENNIMCPYCDWEDNDSWEFDDDEGIVTCGNCEKEFNVSRDISVSYSTSKIECKDDKHDYKFNHYFKSDRQYKNREWTNLPSSEHKYYKINDCTICDKTEFEQISEEEFIKNAELL